jgi:hypothetical protein
MCLTWNSRECLFTWISREIHVNFTWISRERWFTLKNSREIHVKGHSREIHVLLFTWNLCEIHVKIFVWIHIWCSFHVKFTWIFSREFHVRHIWLCKQRSRVAAGVALKRTITSKIAALPPVIALTKIHGLVHNIYKFTPSVAEWLRHRSHSNPDPQGLA